MTYDHIRVTPLAIAVGAEVSEIDLAVPPGETRLAEIRRALGANTVSCSSTTSI